MSFAGPLPPWVSQTRVIYLGHAALNTPAYEDLTTIGDTDTLDAESVRFALTERRAGRPTATLRRNRVCPSVGFHARNSFSKVTDDE